MRNIRPANLSVLPVTAVLLLCVPLAVAAPCGARDAAAQKTCKAVTAKAMPADLRKFIAKAECGVVPGSPYDEGWALDLNADGNPEYWYCCSSPAHGPCAMEIFAKVSGQWTAASDGYAVPSEGVEPCGNLVPLADKHRGYSDVCIDDGAAVLKFSGGRYAE